ncbi:C40 family peptidase [Erwinia sorbitola]|uniref:Endopeptidase n=1 Tax=Erwinia sorbitola TaxID=2681984 RepID=A0A6I6EHI3_9GAMM|nr:C40 family peptidase [Erwinia sorbitola]QGU87385.1 endopeptidase [Erwinia sorbitola]
MRLLITLFILAFTQLFFNMAHASPHAPINANQQKADSNSAHADDRRKRRPVKTTSTKKAKEPVVKKTKVTAKKEPTRAATKKEPSKAARLVLAKKLKDKEKKKTAVEPPRKLKAEKQTLSKKLAANKKAGKKLYGRKRAGSKTVESDMTEPGSAPLKLSKAHRARYQKARETAMNKLMGQLGKPYQWGGTSPKTGFDCSGLVWYAYKDLVKFKIPRTANEMYHLRDAAAIKRDELEKGDLVFFRINGRGTADHVGVYLGGGKFIQSPRTGKDIQVSALSEDYWQEHYIGARRMMTPKTIR